MKNIQNQKQQKIMIMNIGCKTRSLYFYLQTESHKALVLFPCHLEIISIIEYKTKFSVS